MHAVMDAARIVTGDIREAHLLEADFSKVRHMHANRLQEAFFRPYDQVASRLFPAKRRHRQAKSLVGHDRFRRLRGLIGAIWHHPWIGGFLGTC